MTSEQNIIADQVWIWKFLKRHFTKAYLKRLKTAEPMDNVKSLLITDQKTEVLGKELEILIIS